MNKPSIVEERLLLKGLRFSVVRRKYVKPGNGIFERDVVLFPEAVVVLPVLPGEEVVLVRQFRAPFNDFVIEAPAGVVDPGERPEETAVRELVEETGYEPEKLVKLGSFTPAPGYSSEVLHFYVAFDLKPTKMKPEEYEVIEPIKLSFNEAYRMVVDNRIRDMKTALVILLYKQRREVGTI